jgi:hypothetical protein
VFLRAGIEPSKRWLKPRDFCRDNTQWFQVTGKEKVMVDILHRVGMKSSVDKVYKALTTREGGAAWWTTNTQGDGSKVGGILNLRLAPAVPK